MTWETGNKQRTGFTLVELGVVVFILAMLLAVSAPSFVRSFQSSSLNEAARNFVTTCQFARLQAVVHGQPATLHVDVDNHRFWVTQPGNNTEPEAEGATLKVVELPMRVAIARVETELDDKSDSRGVAVDFLPNGTAGDITVVFRGRDPKIGVAATLDAITGKATVYPVNL